jgi:ABC-type multidrug transport system ATPase subunit
VTTQLVGTKICKRYGAQTILDQVDFSVSSGEVVALTGENGAGKTTLLRIFAGILRADAGTIRVGGRIGYCPQIPGLFELLDVNDHLIMFGRGSGLNRTESVKRGQAILAEFDFPVDRKTVVRDLSGGTRQKLNLALALLAEPSVLLLDEPYQGFDRGTYMNFWDHCQIWRQQGKAVVVVTHMLPEFDRADRVVELAPHPSHAHRRDAS